MSKTGTSGSLLGWLGRRSSDRADSPADARDAGKPGARDSIQMARRRLLDEITEFLLGNGLEISAANLTAAHAAFSGLDPRLGRKIAQQAAEGPITQALFDQLIAEDSDIATEESLKSLMTKLEATVETFSGHAVAARTATSAYTGELEQHVAGLTQIDDTEEFISTFADLAKAMLDRTRKLETEMRKSENEAAKLRASLEKAKRDAEIDHLTGLPNRKAFEAVLDSEFREARAALEPLVIAFCDIDHFKRVNDTHGHEAGDRVIRLIAETLSEVSHDKCHVARHGGEEFVMLFRGLNTTEAFERLDDLRENLATRNFVNRTTDEPLGQITFSAGIADIFAFADPRAALKAADEALYAAKENGRNQVQIASTDACRNLH